MESWPAEGVNEHILFVYVVIYMAHVSGMGHGTIQIH